MKGFSKRESVHWMQTRLDGKRIGFTPPKPRGKPVPKAIAASDLLAAMRSK